MANKHVKDVSVTHYREMQIETMIGTIRSDQNVVIKSMQTISKRVKENPHHRCW